MSQLAGLDDDEGIQLTYSSLPPGKHLYISPATPTHGTQPEPWPSQASFGVWHRPYHRPLGAAFLSAVLALGMLLGIIMSGRGAPLSSSSLTSRPGQHMPLPPTPATVLGGAAVSAATLDARFAIVTLGIQCLGDLCDESWYVSAGQHIYALHAGASCTTTTPVEVVGRLLQYVYCRLDLPNVYSSTFDGAPLECVGSRLGCHFVLRVETTNGH